MGTGGTIAVATAHPAAATDEMPGRCRADP